MNIKLKYRLLRQLALGCVFSILFQVINPISVWALTSGPSQPEFSSFEPIATTNMVNEFSGDFTYNLPLLEIPGANGGGYAMSLSYHSGASPEEESSWVGYGWTLNPGAINRGKRGFPDDYNNKTITYWNKTPANWTVAAGGNISPELFSYDVPVSGNATLRYNNYKGFGYTAGVGISVGGVASLGFSVTDGEGSFSASINPIAALSKAGKLVSKNENSSSAKKTLLPKILTQSKIAKKIAGGLQSVTSLGSQYGLFSMSETIRPTQVTSYVATSVNFSLGVLGAPLPIEGGFSGNLTGSYTVQQNLPLDGQDILKAYGYMYSNEADASNTSMMDYYVEKENAYDKRDVLLGIPFNNADNYSISGEGIGGGFRLHSRNAGHFHPNSKMSTTIIGNASLEVDLGLDIGGGVDAGKGSQTLLVDAWNNATSFPSGTSDEPMFFRFNNDLGGSVEFGTNDNAQTASISNENPVVSNIIDMMNGGERSGRSSYIAYHTNEEMNKTSSTGKKYYAYSLHSSTEGLINRDETAIKDQIGEIITFNEDGARYTYGLPVYSRNEKNLQFSVEGATPGQVTNNYLVHKDITNTKVKVGEESNVPYATSYLLTSIVTSDYVDRTLNGPTDDDFGGWTRFIYTRAYGPSGQGNGNKEGTPNNTWYKWRIPYNGLLYNRNTLSDPEDDMGSVVAGEKEVYYLSAIETKTHKAVFTTSIRLDGIEAKELENPTDPADKGTNTLKQLDKIELKAKDKDGNPTTLIKTVYFKYNNSLAQNIPNTNGTTGSKGKLTLKKVWFEYEGVIKAKISPYVFDYQYKTFDEYDNILPANLSSKYDNVISHADAYSSADENPDYNPLNIDAWGNYQKGGDNWYDSMRIGVNQFPNDDFDPAAWQLKQIQLPSGGEIHIQYEQDDYAYVENKKAMMLMALKDNNSDDDVGKYYIDEARLNIIKEGTWQQTQQIVDIRKLIHDQFVKNDERMYFKFLYKLIGSGETDPKLGDCNAEYVTGYVQVKSVGIDNDGLYVVLGSKDGKSKYDLPKKVCKDLVKSEKQGKLNTMGNCDASATGITQSSDAKKAIMGLINFATSFDFKGSTRCASVNFPLSYLKVPLHQAKKGGGVRVKRLLMFDKGIETGDAALYGSEYIYKTLEDGKEISSGVATFEPSTMREENPLVRYEPKKHQSFLSKIISGRDKEQLEGPFGETMYPSPSVGYSKVVVKNIHQGKTSTGMTVSEFYTAYNFPVEVEATEVVQNQFKKTIIPAGLINIFKNNIGATQGFSIKLNSMHGQPRRVATYGGDYKHLLKPDSVYLSTEQVFEYFGQNEAVPMLYDLTQTIVYEHPGKETEVVFTSKKVEDITNDGNIEADFDVGLPFFIPYVSGIPSYTYAESKLYTHMTTKVIRYPAIQKSVTTYQDGIYHKTENIAFNPHTGKPWITQTTDGFNDLDLLASADHKGVYTNFSFPASQQYKEMGQKAKNENVKVIVPTSQVQLTESGGEYYLDISNLSSSSVCDFINLFNHGDLIKVNADKFYHVVSITNDKVNLEKSYWFNSGGNAGVDSIRVIKSGSMNQLSAQIGAITTYKTGLEDMMIQNNISSSDQSQINSLESNLNGLIGLGGTINTSQYPNIYISKNGCGIECDTLSNVYDEIELILEDCDTFVCPGEGCGSPGTYNYEADKDVLYASTSIYFYDPPTPYICDYRLNLNKNGQTICSYDIDDVAFEGQLYQMNFVFSGSGITISGTKRGEFACEFPIGEFGCYTYPFSIPIGCINFCSVSNPIVSIGNVLSASAQTYTDDWTFNTDLANVYKVNLTGNPYEQGIKGKWRQKDNYVYQIPIIGGARDTERIYKDAGIFDTFTVFNWADPTLNDPNWTKLNTVTLYDPNGNALEEENILGIKSTAKFGYDKTLPYLVAQNAEYSSVYFESFERKYGSPDTLEDGLPLTGGGSQDATTYHSGRHSLKLDNAEQMTMKDVLLTQQIKDNGLLIKVWVKDLSYDASPISCTVEAQSVTMNKIAEVGEWQLYEGRMGSFEGFTVGVTQLTPVIIEDIPSGSIYIDDVRIQPADAQMICYVYDINTHRLLTSFDDQHFGLYYQYNKEGKLVRKEIETERGKYSIQETQYHTPMISR